MNHIETLIILDAYKDAVGLCMNKFLVINVHTPLPKTQETLNSLTNKRQ